MSHRALLLCLLVPCFAGATVNAPMSEIAPPKTPRGLRACEDPLRPLGSPMDLQGERIEYDLEVMGVDLGTLRLQTGRRGTHNGEPVTEYKSDLQVDRGVASLVPLEGSAATLMTDTHHTPVQAAHRYRWTTVRMSEVKKFANDARAVSSQQVGSDGNKSDERTFGMPVQDFLSGVYYLRRLPRHAEGCAVVYSNQKAFTLWLEDDGEEMIKTPWGNRMADRYKVRYGNDVHKKVREARFWVSQDALRVPFRAEGINEYKPRAELQAYTAPVKK